MAIRKSTRRRPGKIDESYQLPEPVEIPHEEAWAQFDARARELLGISGEEFIERFERGDYAAGPEDQRVTEVYFAMVSRPPATS